MSSTSFMQSTHSQFYNTCMLSLVKQWQKERVSNQQSKFFSCIYLFFYAYFLVATVLSTVQNQLQQQLNTYTASTNKSFVPHSQHQNSKNSAKQEMIAKKQQVIEHMNNKAFKSEINEFIFFVMLYSGTIDLLEQDWFHNIDVKFWCKHTKSGELIPASFAHLPGESFKNSKRKKTNSSEILPDEEPRCGFTFLSNDVHNSNDAYSKRIINGLCKGYIWNCISARVPNGKKNQYVNQQFMDSFSEQIQQCQRWYKETFSNEESHQAILASCKTPKKIKQHRTQEYRKYFMNLSTYQPFTHQQIIQFFQAGESVYIEEYNKKSNLREDLPVAENLLLGSIISPRVMNFDNAQIVQIKLKSSGGNTTIDDAVEDDEIENEADDQENEENQTTEEEDN